MKDINEVILDFEMKTNPELKKLLREKDELLRRYPKLVEYDKLIYKEMSGIKSSKMRLLYLAELMKELSAVMLSTVKSLDHLRRFNIRD